MNTIYVKVVINTNGTKTSDLRTFESRDEALATYHYQLGASINKCKECLYVLLDSEGKVIKSEKWVAPVVEEEE